MPSHTASNNPNAHMRMSIEAKARMRSTERALINRRMEESGPFRSAQTK